MFNKVQIKITVDNFRRKLADFIHPKSSKTLNVSLNYIQMLHDTLSESYIMMTDMVRPIIECNKKLQDELVVRQQQTEINSDLQSKSELLSKCHELRDSFIVVNNFYSYFKNTDRIIQDSIWNFLNSSNNEEANENLLELVSNFNLYDSTKYIFEQDIQECSDNQIKLFNFILEYKLETDKLINLCRSLKFIVERTEKSRSLSYNKYIPKFKEVLFQNCRKDIADCFWSLLNSKNEETAKVRLENLKELRKGLSTSLDFLFKDYFDEFAIQILKDIMSFKE